MEAELDVRVRVPHNYRASTGELLTCEREPANAHDRYAVAILKNGTIIGVPLPHGSLSFKENISQ